MKRFAYLLLTISLFCASSCGNKMTSTSQQEKLKARFEVKALCSNYTFSVIEGNIDTSLVVTSWTNPQTNNTYTNAFGISNPCDLPKDLEEGDEFYFTIDKRQEKQCAVCMAYYPTPEKKLTIKVLDVIKK